MKCVFMNETSWVEIKFKTKNISIALWCLYKNRNQFRANNCQDEDEELKLWNDTYQNRSRSQKFAIV